MNVNNEKLFRVIVVTLLLAILALLVDSRSSGRIIPNIFPITQTAHAESEDVKTNPQSEVGGIDAVNELFKGDGVGQSPVPEPEKSTNWPLIIGLGAIPLICLLLAIIILKKKGSDDE